MATFDWENRIREWSKKRIETLNDREKENLPSEVLESGYLGCPGATEEQIAAAEARLGVTFPPSYREFFKASNGLKATSEYGLYFYPVEDVDWYALNYQDWVDELIESHQEPVPDEDYFVYGEDQCDIFRPEYLQTALDISSEDRGGIFLLNPQIVIDNEWEAWYCIFTSAWRISRYRSFGEMMNEFFSDSYFAD